MRWFFTLILVSLALFENNLANASSLSSLLFGRTAKGTAADIASMPRGKALRSYTRPNDYVSVDPFQPADNSARVALVVEPDKWVLYTGKDGALPGLVFSSNGVNYLYPWRELMESSSEGVWVGASGFEAGSASSRNYLVIRQLAEDRLMIEYKHSMPHGSGSHLVGALKVHGRLDDPTQKLPLAIVDPHLRVIRFINRPIFEKHRLETGAFNPPKPQPGGRESSEKLIVKSTTHPHNVMSYSFAGTPADLDALSEASRKIEFVPINKPPASESDVLALRKSFLQPGSNRQQKTH